jgi:hypothetical protein
MFLIKKLKKNLFHNEKYKTKSFQWPKKLNKNLSSIFGTYPVSNAILKCQNLQRS